MSGKQLRLDKWLWHARFFKSRSFAARLCAVGRVRINRAVVNKTHATVKPGDVVTFPQARDIRVVEVVALGGRRGTAPEARTLYRDLAPPSGRGGETAHGARARGAGRPTKAHRRAIARLKERDG